MQNRALFGSHDLANRQPRSRRLPARAAIIVLISAATGALLLCPCDCVDLHDHYALLLLGLAGLFSLAASVLIYRQMARDSGITGFLKAVIAGGLVVCCVYAELLLAMEGIPWLARR